MAIRPDFLYTKEQKYWILYWFGLIPVSWSLGFGFPFCKVKH